MRKKKIGVFFLIFLLTIGFASLNTILNFEGAISLGMKSFKVRFNRAIVNGANKTDIFNGDKTSMIIRHKDISSVEESIIDYELKNESIDYDAEATVVCESAFDNGTTFLYGEEESETPTKLFIRAGEIESGSLKIKLVEQEADTTINKGTVYDKLIAADKDRKKVVTDTDSGEPIYIYQATEDETETTTTTNHIIFGGMCWLGMRTTETGGVKLIYNGIPVNGVCLPFGNAFTQRLVPYTKWTLNTGSYNAYVGYMYGSTSATTYAETHSNTKDSAAKKALDKWYEQNLKDTKYEDYIEDTVYCNDRTVRGADTAEDPSTLGVGSNSTTYEHHEYKCPNNNDRFTVSSELGNGALKYPIGTLTYSEASDASNYTSYGYATFYTMTPYSNGVMRGKKGYNLTTYATNTTSDVAVVPVISIKQETLILKGDGTQTTPFMLETEDISNNQYTCKLEVVPIGRTSEAEDDPFEDIQPGDEYCIGNECFWVLEADMENRNLKLFAKYNLYVGDICATYTDCESISTSDPLYLKQNEIAAGYTVTGDYPYIGVVQYGTSSNQYNSSIVKNYVDAYADYLNTTYGTNVLYKELITAEELENLGCERSAYSCRNTWNNWILGRTYWAMTTSGTGSVYLVGADGFYGASSYKTSNQRGVRPVITIHVEKTVVEDPDNPVNTRYNLYETVKNLSKGLDTTNSIDYDSKSSVTNGNGVYETNNTDTGKSVYFYRGEVDNNVIFADTCWKIVRTTETNGTKLIYNGKPSQGVCSNSGDDVLIGKSKFNEKQDDNAYVGYMYGTPGSSNYDATHENKNNSAIKEVVDAWYEDNLLDTEYEKQLEDTTFCNDRSLVPAGSSGNNKYSTSSRYASKLGYGTNGTLYGTNSRFASQVVTAKPSLACPLANDRFSVSEDIGNGDLKYPIGLISADEVGYAGATHYRSGSAYSNETYYLYGDGAKFFTMSAHLFDSNKRIFFGAVNADDADHNGYFGIELGNSESGVRPVISLKNSVTFTIGTGTEINPYIIDSISEFDEGDVPVSWRDDGLFKKYYTDAYKKLLSMSIDEKVGQLLLAHHTSTATTPSESITKYHVAGFTYFEADFTGKTEAAVQSMISNEQNSAKIPLITAVDEEGGVVVRISPNTSLISAELTKYPDLFYKNSSGKTAWKLSKDLYKDSGNNFDLINTETKVKSKVLKRLGLNVNFGPVVDMAIPGAYISNRVIGLDAAGTGKYAKNVITSSKGTGVSYTLKHFPGYGNNSDTHQSGSVDTKTLEELMSNDMVPFAEGIKAGAEAIMISHNTVAAIDSENPSSISKSMHDILRDDLKYTGIIFTDALEMGATASIQDKYIKAVNAGNNILLVSDCKEAFTEIKKGYYTGSVSEEQIDKLVFKTLAWKYYKGLM